MKYCLECGKALASETSKFCDNCGTKVNAASPPIQNPEQKEPVLTINEEKNPYLALLCSFFIPGLGQVYNGLTARGIAFFFGTLIGVIIFIIPGFVIWIYGMYDAFSTAEKMNNKEIPFLPTKTAHLIIFIILAIFIIAIVAFIIFITVLSVMFAPLAHQITPAPALIK